MISHPTVFLKKGRLYDFLPYGILSGTEILLRFLWKYGIVKKITVFRLSKVRLRTVGTVFVVILYT